MVASDSPHIYIVLSMHILLLFSHSELEAPKGHYFFLVFFFHLSICCYLKYSVASWWLNRDCTPTVCWKSFEVLDLEWGWGIEQTDLPSGKRYKQIEKKKPAKQTCNFVLWHWNQRVNVLPLEYISSQQMCNFLWGVERS